MHVRKRLHRAVDHLLASITPENGAVSLLFKHPARPDVFFPLALAKTPSVETRPSEILDHYYLYSMRLDVASFSSGDVLSKDSPISKLVLSGKLAIRLFPTGPVELRIEFCDPEHRIALCVMKPCPGGKETLGPISEDIRSAVAEIAAAWQELSENSIDVNYGTSRQIAEAITALLCDSVAEPPYFGILYAVVNFDKGQDGALSGGQWRANALSHHVFLMSKRDVLVHDYIEHMVKGDDTKPYCDPRPDHNDADLAGAIAKVCRDRFHCIGKLRNGTAKLFARCNIPTEDAGQELERGEVDRHRQLKLKGEVFLAETSWELIDHALKYLGGRHEDSALVTVWLGLPDESDCAFPIGLRHWRSFATQVSSNAFAIHEPRHAYSAPTHSQEERVEGGTTRYTGPELTPGIKLSGLVARRG